MSRLLDRLTELVTIDWLEVGVTRGCFVTGIYPFELADERTDGRPVIVAAGGLCVPSRPRWEPWARWFHLPRLMDTPPPFSVPRGGIDFDPDEMLGSRLCLAKLDEGRCHLYLTRDGDRFRCPAGHTWNTTAQQVRP